MSSSVRALVVTSVVATDVTTHHTTAAASLARPVSSVVARVVASMTSHVASAVASGLAYTAAAQTVVALPLEALSEDCPQLIACDYQHVVLCRIPQSPVAEMQRGCPLVRRVHLVQMHIDLAVVHYRDTRRDGV